MKSPYFLAFTTLLTATTSACIESPQTEVSYAAEARSTLASTFVVGNVTVKLTRADIAFGPVYFCAANAGSAVSCKSSLAESTDVTRIDLLTPSSPLGKVRGYTGSIRSASYDLGLHWFDTSFSIESSPAAPDGHSMVFEGTLARAGEGEVPFRFLVDVVPQYKGQRAVPTSEAVADITDANQKLLVSFEPEPWLRQIDFDAVLEKASRPIVLDSKKPEHDALLVGLKVARPPEFRWSRN
jgi:hypothetical protein